MNSIESKWKDFEMRCLVHDSPEERQKIRVAFYAGVISLFSLQDKLAHNLSPEEMILTILTWKDELENFKAEQSARAVVAILQARR